MLHPDRYFSPVPEVRAIARALYQRVANLPLVCPHGHVDPRILADDAPFPEPAALIIIPDHYIFRMLYSQGVPMESLGVPTARRRARRDATRARSGSASPSTTTCSAARRAARGSTTSSELFRRRRAADGGIGGPHLRRDRRTPARRRSSGRARCSSASTSRCSRTTDAASDPLECHQRDSRSRAGPARASRPSGRTRVYRIARRLARRDRRAVERRMVDDRFTDLRIVTSARSRIAARYFKSLGATATDHAVVEPYTASLSPGGRGVALRPRAARRRRAPPTQRASTAHMLMEMARMSSRTGW